MNYLFRNDVRQNDALRDSFNALTRKTFGFDFSEWYRNGHWGDCYVPHVLTDKEGKVIANVSVNHMTFHVNGEKKHYIQLGTVMTDTDYRKQGLGRYIMERVLEEYQHKTDGIYLFGNDSVLEYYPKFGFRAMEEYTYSRCVDVVSDRPYQMSRVDLSNRKEAESFYGAIRQFDEKVKEDNRNDAFCMHDNLGLYQFWLAAEYGEMVYKIAEEEAYVIAGTEGDTLQVLQIVGNGEIDMKRLASAFDGVKKIELSYTPVKKEEYQERLHKEEDCTLFVLGDSLCDTIKSRIRFPVISHA